MFNTYSFKSQEFSHTTDDISKRWFTCECCGRHVHELDRNNKSIVVEFSDTTDLQFYCSKACKEFERE